MQARRAHTIAWCVAALLGACACSRQDAQLQQHQEALASLHATTHFVIDAWLRGNVSGTYAETALQRTLRLAEQERTALTARPQLLIDRRGADLSDAADGFERRLATLIHAVRGADGGAARR